MYTVHILASTHWRLVHIPPVAGELSVYVSCDIVQAAVRAHPVAQVAALAICNRV